MDFSRKKNVDIFEKLSDFLILYIVLKKKTSLLSEGCRPHTKPMRKARDTLYVSWAFPLEKILATPLQKMI